MKYCQTGKNIGSIVAVFFIIICGMHHFTQAHAPATTPIGTFCEILTKTLCDGDSRPLDIVIEELITIIHNNHASFVKTFGSETKLNEFITTLKTIQTRVRAKNIAPREIGSLLSPYVPFLPQPTQNKLNINSTFSLLKLALNIKRSINAVKN